ncbi:YdcF family protein [candidate division KSB1 bacterium]|nr:YdcF family protein [candidate division KSB1 bacterium]
MIKVFLSPLFASLVLIIIALVFVFHQRKKFSKVGRNSIYIALFGTISLFTFSLPSVSFLLAKSLEHNYLSYDGSALKQLDVIVVLASGFKRGNETVADELTGTTYSRTVTGIRAFKTSNARIIVMSGGTGDILDTNMVCLMRSLAIEMGIPKNKIIIDPLSCTTFDHPVRVIGLSEVTKNDQIGVATSAWHLPRAMVEFRKYFSKVIAIPCDYYSLKIDKKWLLFFPSIFALEASRAVIHELIGYCWYRIKS